MEVKYIIDIIVVLILAIGLYIGMKRGFVYSLLSLFSYVISVIAAKVCSVYAGMFIYNTFIKASVEKALATQIQSAMDNAGITTLSKANISELVGSIRLDAIGFLQTEKITASLEALKGISASNATELSTKVTQSVFSTPIINMLANISFVIIFFIVLGVVKAIVSKTKLISKIPLVGGINKAAGAALGGLTAVAIIFVVAKLCSLFISFDIGTNIPWFNENIMSTTLLFRYFYYF